MLPHERRQWQAIIDDPSMGIKQRVEECLKGPLPEGWTRADVMDGTIKGLQQTYQTPAQMREEMEEFNNTPPDRVFGHPTHVGRAFSCSSICELSPLT